MLILKENAGTTISSRHDLLFSDNQGLAYNFLHTNARKLTDLQWNMIKWCMKQQALNKRLLKSFGTVGPK